MGAKINIIPPSYKSFKEKKNKNMLNSLWHSTLIDHLVLDIYRVRENLIERPKS